MDGALVISPALVPLTAALIAAALGRRLSVQRAVAIAGVAVSFGCAVALIGRVASQGALRVTLGGWPAPFGIEFVADGLGASMVLMTAIIGAVTLSFQSSTADPAPERSTLFPLMLTLLGGVGGAFLTADLFNLYVWFEVMLLSSLGLFALGGHAINLDATLKYFVLNAFGTLLFLVGIAYVYGSTGHLNYDALAAAAGRQGAERWLPFAVPLALAFLVKAGAFPVFAWLPASYHTLSAPLLALFSALLTKVGVYALLRIFAGLFAKAPHVLFGAMGWLAVLTMIVGALGAAYHWDMRRILAFHIVSQIGYLLLGIALGTPHGNAATIFYLLHNVLAKTNLILIAALVFRTTGSYDLRLCGGMYDARPALSVLFLVSALSMVGVPPLSGFWAKFMLVREALVIGRSFWAVAALFTGFLTLYSMMKIWIEAFWKRHPDERWSPTRAKGLWPGYLSVGTLAALILVMGLLPDPIVRFLEQAAEAMSERLLTANVEFQRGAAP